MIRNDCWTLPYNFFVNYFWFGGALIKIGKGKNDRDITNDIGCFGKFLDLEKKIGVGDLCFFIE